MANLNFDPVVGEEVRMIGNPGLFEIVGVYPPNWTTVPPGWENNSMGAEGGRTVDLRRVGSDSIVRNIRWDSLKYVDETRPVRRAIEWLKENPVVPFPGYVLDYQVEARDDHQGNPAFYVRFFVEPDDQPSPAKIEELNRFRGSVQTMLLTLGLDRWPYVQVSEKRSLLDVAS
jgi:hypothetical protein